MLKNFLMYNSLIHYKTTMNWLTPGVFHSDIRTKQLLQQQISQQQKSDGHQQAFSAAQEKPYFYGNLCIRGNAESATEVAEAHLYLKHLKRCFLYKFISQNSNSYIIIIKSVIIVHSLLMSVVMNFFSSSNSSLVSSWCL